jgi:hypothetical protein
LKLPTAAAVMSLLSCRSIRPLPVTEISGERRIRVCAGVSSSVPLPVTEMEEELVRLAARASLPPETAVDPL